MLSMVIVLTHLWFRRLDLRKARGNPHHPHHDQAGRNCIQHCAFLLLCCIAAFEEKVMSYPYVLRSVISQHRFPMSCAMTRASMSPEYDQVPSKCSEEELRGESPGNSSGQRRRLSSYGQCDVPLPMGYEWRLRRSRGDCGEIARRGLLLTE